MIHESLNGFHPPPAAFTGLDGVAYRPDETDLVARVISMGNCHRAFALTSAMCLAVAARIDGTVVRECSSAADDADVRLGHTGLGQPLPREHGGPVRMITRKLYA